MRLRRKMKGRDMTIETEKSRRQFIAQALTLGAAVGPLALAAPLGAEVADKTAAPDVQSPAITPITIQEAEKLQAVELTAAQCAALAAAAPAQVKVIESLRDPKRPLGLRPALNFDPRLPGTVYSPQKNDVRLSALKSRQLPIQDVDIAFAPVTQLAGWLKSRQLTSARLTEIYLERITRLAPALCCYISVCADAARTRARAMDSELDAGRYRGPLHGVPYSLKDVFDTQGLATTWGCSLYRDRVPAADAAVVGKIADAGAVLLGKVSMGELANGWEWFGGKVRNPWNPSEPAGGSSSGSGAATAAGLCAFSIGSDSLGSILNPADRCGTVGLRPTFGRVPVAGAMPLTPSLERIGPLCRSIEDAVLILAVINGPDPSSGSSVNMGFTYDASLNASSLRVGYSPQWFEQIGFAFGAKHTASTSSAEHNALEALRSLGVTLVPVQLPQVNISALFEICYVESGAIFESLSLSGEDAQLVNQIGWPPQWRQARFLSAIDYMQIERYRRQVMQQMHELFETVDVLFGPTYGSPELLFTTNFTGHPGVTMRAGLIQSHTRPMDLERFFSAENSQGALHTITRNVAFHGRLYEEGRMLALAHHLETRLNVAHLHPDDRVPH
jgi:Asp-tRNA(Asn)/Glu-tRNA(Gln) amidotransferase A subunit family amidase